MKANQILSVSPKSKIYFLVSYQQGDWQNNRLCESGGRSEFINQKNVSITYMWKFYNQFLHLTNATDESIIKLLRKYTIQFEEAIFLL